MNRFWIKPHRIVRMLFHHFVWRIKTRRKEVYLTFDDGPTPEITEWVLDQLKSHKARATFFCIGNNITQHPTIFKKTVTAGHSIGNHTANHPSGWETENSEYFKNVGLCDAVLKEFNIQDRLFRPPYGKIKRSQSQYLRKRGYKIIMWDVLSADFDVSVSREECRENVIKNIEPGSIIVFHDSVRASDNLKFALPETLEYLSANEYRCEAL